MRKFSSILACTFIGYIFSSDGLAQHFDCSPLAQVPKSEVTLIGEIHGTNEIPVLAVEQACTLAQSGKQVIFFLELPRGEQAAVDRFLASEGKQRDRDSLISSKFWQSEEIDDGRSSIAIVDLFERVRVLRAQGAKISTLLDDGFESDDRDMAMAKAILSARESFPEAAIIALLGGLHSSESPARERHPYQAVGYRLKELQPLTVYVNFRGWSWGCTQKGCGVMKVGVVGQNSVFFKYIPGDEIDHAHDGVVNLPKVTASPPARFLLRTY